jgi:hypothetical protein
MAMFLSFRLRTWGQRQYQRESCGSTAPRLFAQRPGVALKLVMAALCGLVLAIPAFAGGPN